MDKLLKFPDCPCVFPIRKHPNGYIQPLVNFSYGDIQDCPKVWDLYASGLLAGVFQVDSALGMKWAKELRPTSLEHLTAMVSIVRPGTLNSMDEKGKSLTQKYCDRKNGKETTPIQFPALDDILKDTYGVLCYQESQISICQQICGFTAIEADELRRGVGKKLMKVILSLEQKFIDGAKRVGKVSESDAKSIFEWIKSASRYSFNKCLHPKTLVERKEGDFKYIYNIEIGDYIRIPNHCGPEKKYSKVVNIFNQGKQKLYLCKFGQDDWISCTLNHKFRCIGGQLYKLSDVLAGDVPVFNDKNEWVRCQQSIYDCDYLDTYDLEIEDEEHVFYADGIAVSNSHASGYAIRSRNEAYLKTHFPVAFYTSKLKSPRNSKTHEDINDLVYEAKQFGIESGLPDIRDLREEFYHDGQKIFFGLTDIKSFGQSGFSAVADMVSKTGPQVWSSFFEFSINSSRYLTDSVVKLLIKAGAVDFFGMTRSQMLEEYELVSKLTKTEKINLFRYYDAEKLGIFDTKSEISSDE